MNGAFRAARRAVAACLVTMAVWLGLLVSLAIIFPWRSGRRAVQRFWIQRWGRWMARAIGVQLTTHGSPPEHPCLLVSNHLSYVDIFLVASLVPCRFVTKSELRGWPLVGWFCRSAACIFVDRSSRRDAVRVIGEIQTGVRDGDSIVVFPEGTSTAGYEVKAFQPPLLAAAVNQPVHYAAISYAIPHDTPPAHLTVCWWGEMPFLSHLYDLLKVPVVHATLHFGAEPVSNQDRKQLAHNLQQAVSEIFRPVVESASAEEMVTTISGASIFSPPNPPLGGTGASASRASAKGRPPTGASSG